MDPAHAAPATMAARRPLREAAAHVLPAFVLTLGVDLFLHAGALARYYVRDIPFLVPPAVAFRRIPAGYLAFLLLTAALYWLVRQADVRGAGRGFRWGAVAGLTVWGTLLLGLWSITTAPADLLLAWWVGQGLELGLAGAVRGAARAGTPLRRIWTAVAVAVLVLFAATIGLQAAGLAPAVKIP